MTPPLPDGSVRPMEQWRVEKKQVQVTLTTTDGTVLNGDLYLATTSSHHVGPERVVDLFNGDNDFVPFKASGAKEAVILNRNNLLEIIVGETEEALPYLTASSPTVREVTVFLNGGETRQGKLMYVMPPEDSRVSDFLNNTDRFFPLVIDDKTHLLLRSSVVRVE